MRTDFAKEIWLIAQRIIAERESGRQVDPMRLAWAETILRNNAPAIHKPAEIGAAA